ncbi:MAG: hypothetical protein ABI199_08730 [Bacteroidia bacterium]
MICIFTAIAKDKTISKPAKAIEEMPLMKQYNAIKAAQILGIVTEDDNFVRQ